MLNQERRKRQIVEAERKAREEAERKAKEKADQEQYLQAKFSEIIAHRQAEVERKAREEEVCDAARVPEVVYVCMHLWVCGCTGMRILGNYCAASRRSQAQGTQRRVCM